MNRDEAAELERLRLENEQLLESRRLADETRDRYMDLHDHLPLAHLTLDGVGIIRELNEDALELLGGGAGDGRPRLAGTRLKRLLRDEDHPVLAAHLREGPVRRDTFSCEVRRRCGCGAGGSGRGCASIRRSCWTCASENSRRSRRGVCSRRREPPRSPVMRRTSSSRASATSCGPRSPRSWPR